MKKWILAHRKLSIALALIVVIVGYIVIKKSSSTTGETRYVLAKVEEGTLTTSVTGSGQVSAQSQVDVNPKASGEVTYVGVKAGQKVRKGQSLFSIDAKDAQKAVRDAELSLESAKLSLESQQNQNNSSVEDKELAVKTAYQDLLNSSLEALPESDITDQKPPTITGNYNLGKEGDIKISVYKSVGGFSFRATGLVDASGMVSVNSPQPIGNSGLYITFATDTADQMGPEWIIHIPNTKSSNYLSNYNKYQTALSDLEKVKTGTDTSITSLKSAELTVRQRENDLLDAKQKLSDYYVTAPFDGIVASVDAEIGQTASSGTSLATIVTDKKIATISLNEVDVAKIQLGQRATLSFDAVEGLTITGEVAEIDTIGTVSQGVVTYNVKIAFDTQDARIKPGMSASATIITDSKVDTLIVPSSAVKSNTDGTYYVLELQDKGEAQAGVQGVTSSTKPKQVPVEVGISDDTNTEIISGLNVNDEIVSKTVTASTTKTTTTKAPSLIGGGTGGARNFAR